MSEKNVEEIYRLREEVNLSHSEGEGSDDDNFVQLQRGKRKPNLP